MPTFNQFLIELPQNTLYKDFKKSIVTPVQLPLPFEFTDEFFESKKEQMNHTLRKMQNNMMIGYEFEMYVEKQTEDEYSNGELDYDNPEYETTTLSDVRSNYMGELHDYFSEISNRLAYERLNDAFYEWQTSKASEKTEEDVKEEIEKLIELGKLPEDFDEDHEDYDSEYKKLYDDYYSSNEEEFTFDEFVDDQFDYDHSTRSDYNTYRYSSRLLNVIHTFEFENTEDGFDQRGHIIIEVNYPELESENVNEAQYEHLADFLRNEKEIQLVKVLTSAHAENKQYKTTWYIEPDGSLVKYKYDNMFPVEVTTKTYPAYQFKGLFLNFLEWMKEYSNDNVITDDSTGFHFNVSFTDERPIDFVKLIILGKDTFWLKKFGRSFNVYCTSQYDRLVGFIKQSVLDAKDKGTNIPIDFHTIDSIISKFVPIGSVAMTKYYSINFSKYHKYKYIEFRLGGNDYFKNSKRHVELIEWYLRLLVAAATPTLFEKEYHQTLIDIVNTEFKFPKIK